MIAQTGTLLFVEQRIYLPLHGLVTRSSDRHRGDQLAIKGGIEICPDALLRPRAVPGDGATAMARVRHCTSVSRRDDCGHGGDKEWSDECSGLRGREAVLEAMIQMKHRDSGMKNDFDW